MATGTIKATGWTLLWSNPNDSANFGPQTIALDLSAYGEVRVRWKQAASVPSYFVTQIAKGSNDFLMVIGSVVSSAVMRLNRREVATSNSGVEFFACYQKLFNSTSGATTTVTECIPAQIYAR